MSFEAEAIDALYHPVPHSAVLLHGPVVCLAKESEADERNGK